MAWLKPEDGPEVVYEFFSPFAHVPGRYEWCRVLSPTHGVFDLFILLSPEGPGKPATVYVGNPHGQRFMKDRYPECTTYRVQEDDLRLAATPDGRGVNASLLAGEGPLRRVEMKIQATADATPRNEVYGGEGVPVWGSKKYTCWGVDLLLDATADGQLLWSDKDEPDELDREPAIVTLGSFARIAPLKKD
jgi:hypothetical protein